VNPPKVAAVILGALVLQVCLFSKFSFDGARPDVVILVAVAAGFVAGPERGAIVGFAAGVSFDILLTTPLGLSALVYALVGYSVGVLSGGVMRSSRWIAPAVAAVATGVGMVLYAMIGEVLGIEALKGPSLTAIVVVVAALDALLAPGAMAALRWARTDDVDHRRRRPAFFLR
jgi:rod shape-determining protein MreD